MTLEYSSPSLVRPSKGKLIGYGVLLAVGSVFGGLSFLFSALRLLGSQPAASVSSLGTLLLAGGGMYLAIDIIRAQRWTRPAVVGFSLNSLITTVGVVPIMFTSLIYIGAASIFSLVAIAFIIGMITVAIVIPWFYWRHFCLQSTRETLEFFDRDSSWTDRFPMPVIAFGFAVGTKAVLLVCSLLGTLLQTILTFSIVQVLYAMITLLGIAILGLMLHNIKIHNYPKAYRLAMIYAIGNFAVDCTGPFFQAIDIAGLAQIRPGGFNANSMMIGIYALTFIGAAIRCGLILFVLRKIRPAFYPSPQEHGFTLTPNLMPSPTDDPRPVLPL